MKRIGRFLRRYNEFITIPIALVLWYFSPDILRAMDPTAATFGAGILQAILFGLIATLFTQAFAWIILKISWPTLYRELDKRLPEIFKNERITSWMRLKLALAVFSLFLLVMVLYANIAA